MKRKITPFILITLFVLSASLSVAVSFIQASPNSLEQNADVPDYNLYHPIFPKNSFNQNATLSLQNYGTNLANVVLSFYGAVGTTILTEQIPAYGTLILSDSEITELPDGMFSLVVSSDQPIHSVIKTGRSTNDKLAAYNGIPSTSTSSAFGPFYDSSVLSLHNSGQSSATVAVTFYDEDGLAADTHVAMFSPGAVHTVSPFNTNLPAGFIGLALVSSDQPIEGVLSQTNIDGENTFIHQNKLETIGTGAYMPRVFKYASEGEGPRSTKLFIANMENTEIDVILDFSSKNGVTAYSYHHTIPANGSRIMNLAEDSLFEEGMWSVSGTSTGSFSLSEISQYDTLFPNYGTSAYHADPGPGGAQVVISRHLPYVARTNHNYSVFSIQNASINSANIVISYYTISGTLVYNEAISSLPTGGWERYDLSQKSELGEIFEGSVVISADQPIEAMADEYTIVPCTPVSDAQLTRFPIGNIFVGNTTQFSASAAGDVPFTYAWTLDGIPIGDDSGTFQHMFPTSGTYNVGVTITNTCGQETDSLTISVQEPSPLQPDLSTSYKTVNLTSVESGDILTYTLALHNNSSITTTATLTDPIPASINFLPGSVQASDNHPVNFVDGNLIWSGVIVYGTPVIIQFSGEVQSVPLSTVISNTASLVDEFGNETLLSAESVYNPGYSVTINNGDLHTNVPTTTVSFSWNVNDNITHVKISNDGGFGQNGGTTDWLEANEGNPLFANWLLTTYGDLRLPRTVYMKFRDSDGIQYGPFHDEIIYDPTPPQIAEVQLIPITQVQGYSELKEDVIVRVIAGDDNSGIANIHISNDTAFASYTSIPVTSQVTDVNWQLSASGIVYVRVVDRSGNISETATGGDDFYIYLPAILSQQ